MAPGKKRAMAATSEQSPAQSRRLEYKDMFTVLVGPSEEGFTIHASIAITKSNFFKAACRGRWSEADSKIVRLPEISPDTFRAYTQWMYSNEIICNESEEHANVNHVPLMQLYHLADVLADTGLRNKTIDHYLAICCRTRICAGLKAIRWIYEHTPASCTMRKLLVDEHVWCSQYSPDWYDENVEALPAAFIRDVAMGIIRSKWLRPECPWNGDRCTYHEHDDNDYPKCVE